MKNNYLTGFRVFYGKLMTKLNSFGAKKPPFHLPKKIAGYKLVREYGATNQRTNGGTGEYIKNGVSYVVKQHTFTRTDLDLVYMQNEIAMLRLFAPFSEFDKTKDMATVPKLIEVIEKEHSLTVVIEKVPGSHLELASEDKKTPVLNTSLRTLSEMSGRIPESELVKIPHRGPASYAATFAMLFIQAVMKEKNMFPVYFRLFIAFWKNFIAAYAVNPMPLALSHRDLSSINIMYDEKSGRITLIDLENFVFTDSLFDLATIAKAYDREMSKSTMLAFLRANLKNYNEIARFLALNIFFTFQTLALGNPAKPWYQEGKRYLATLSAFLIPELSPHKRVTERVNLAALSFIHRILTHRPDLGSSKKSSTILCYHSVDDGGWRWSTKVADFESQMQYLKEYIVPIDTLASNPPKPGFAISFDDGYEDVYQHAFPVLKKIGKTACVFMIGDPGHADRSELANNKNFLTISQLRELHAAGWEIGFHTQTHCDLRKLTDSELEAEISDGKKKLEEKLGFTVRYFAYPRGLSSKRIIDAVMRAGFEAAFTIDGPRERGEKPYTLSRLSVEGTYSFDQFTALVSPMGQLMTKFYIKTLELKEAIQYWLLTKYIPKAGRHTGRFTFVYQALFALFVAVILALTLRGLPGNPTPSAMNTIAWTDNGPFELSPERGRFALAYSMFEQKSFYFSLPIARFTTPDLGYIHNHYVSLFAPLVSFLIIPGYAIGKSLGDSQVGAYAVIALFAFLNVLLIQKIAKKLGASPIAGAIAGFAFLFGTPSFAYGVSLYQHHISTFLILASLYLLIAFDSFWSMALIWLLIALSIPLDYPNLFLMMPIGIAALGRILIVSDELYVVKFRLLAVRILTFGAAVIPLALFLWFNKISYGNPLQLSGGVTAVQAIGADGKPERSPLLKPEDKQIAPDTKPDTRSVVAFFDTRNAINGLYIILLSPDRGMVTYAPIVLLGLIGAWLLYKQKNKYVIVIIGIILADLILYVLWGDPWGGWAFGARYMIPAYAILALLLAVVITKWQHKTLLHIIIFGVLTYSIIVNTAGALTSNRNPPLVEVLSLEAQSHREEKYTYTRNLDELKNGVSKSFFFQAYAEKKMTAWKYYLLIAGELIIVAFVLSMAARLITVKK